MSVFAAWKQQARRLKLEISALYLAYRDPRVPWYARLVAAAVVAYAFSPIDLIPDPIPVLGYLDDLILVPLGVALALKMIPVEVMVKCREQAQAALSQGKPPHWIAAGVIVVIWLGVAALTIQGLIRFWGS
ncbi:MAG: hypothetical protein DPW09_10355 [Anaerolineae bacterium]|nr:DUF1232 domain-containing protein [Anaerolineales bacterium]MCQ3973835.1 hypothetical protein [Anaerolineae bacterium]